MQFDATTINMLVKGIWETIYMVFLSSALSYVILSLIHISEPTRH